MKLRRAPARRLERNARGGDFVTIQRSAALGGIDLVRARFVTHASPPHTHAEVEVGIVVSGRRLVACRGRHFEARAGSIVMFTPGETHAGAPLGGRGATYRAFLIPRGALDDASRESQTDAPWFGEPVVRDRDLASELVAAHAELSAPGGGSAERLLGALGVLAARYGRPAPGPSPIPGHAGVVRVRAHLERHYAGCVRLGELAAIAGLSVCQLVRVFRATTGLPPYAYLEQIRIHRAAELLRGGVPVSEVALRTGFADQSHLTRMFKRLVGVPPGRYQRSAPPRSVPGRGDQFGNGPG